MAQSERRWLDRATTFNAGGNLLLLDYLHDDIARITSVTSNRAGESWTYSYDQLDRLLVADNLSNNALDQTFTFNSSGNMLSNSRLGTYTYPAAATAARPHAQLTAGPRNYTYDANGNVLSDGTKNFTWDAENRLVTAGTTSFVHAPDGTRLKKVTGAATIPLLGVDLEKNGATWTKYRTRTWCASLPRRRGCTATIRNRCGCAPMQRARCWKPPPTRRTACRPPL